MMWEPYDELPVPEESGMCCDECKQPILVNERYAALSSGNYHKSCIDAMTLTADKE